MSLRKSKTSTTCPGTTLMKSTIPSGMLRLPRLLSLSLWSSWSAIS
jgi:hypothetical protein